MALSRENFELVRDTLQRRSGQVLEGDKHYLVEARLLSLARRQGCDSVDRFLDQLRRAPNELLTGELVEAMSINETYFFRDEHPFDVLRQTILPELFARRASSRCLNIWSAACASGQEPYSLAILLRHYFPEARDWNVRLIASDLCTSMLDRARRGCYTNLEVSRGMPPALREVYLRQQGDGWQMCNEIRDLVDFRRLNLIEAWPHLPDFDLILVRNVLIYFDAASRLRVLGEMRRRLRPDGYLLLGGAETLVHVTNEFRPVAFGATSLFQ